MTLYYGIVDGVLHISPVASKTATIQYDWEYTAGIRYAPPWSDNDDITIVSVDDEVEIPCYHSFTGLANCNTMYLINARTNYDKNMEGMFWGCHSLINLDLSSFNTSGVTNMENMFWNCYELSSLNLSSFNTSSVTTMDSMFRNCRNLLELDLSSFDTSSVEDMGYMFAGCYMLNTIYVSDLWDVSNLSDYSSLFLSCNNLIGGSGQAYDSSINEKSMANYETGYLTYKDAPEQATKIIYFNGNSISNVYFNGTKMSTIYFNGTRIY